MKTNNIYNKVKTLSLATVLAASATGMLSSCGDFLEIEPQNEITLEKFWNEKVDVEKIIAGCYSSLASDPTLSRMMIWGEFRSENIINNGTITDNVDLERLLKEDITASNVYTYWGDFYKVINTCNTVIQYASGVADNDPTYNGSQVDAHIAEVTALRSLCYFYLIRTFENVPYSEEAFLDDSQTLDLPASSFNEVLDKLIASLEGVKDKALTKYPEGTGLKAYYNTGRVTKQFIYAMLCEMYLWKGDYDSCIRYADLIIEQKRKDAKEMGYSESEFENMNGYPLHPSKYSGMNKYGYAFSIIFGGGNSMESIMELNFEKGSAGNQISNVPVSNFYGADGRTPFVVPPAYVGQDQSGDHYKVFSAENGGYDGRAYENIRFASGVPTMINKYVSRYSVQLDPKKDAYKTPVYGALYETYGDKHESRNKSNFILYRLTDIMLMKAEALAQKISTNGAIVDGTYDYTLFTQAFDLVDAVNKRSLLEAIPTHVLDKNNYLTKTTLTNLVYDERNRELMFEGKRYFDLVRRAMRENSTTYLSTCVANKDASVASFVKSKMSNPKAIFWPYNLDELKVNSNLKQNPAFGSGENDSYTNSAN